MGLNRVDVHGVNARGGNVPIAGQKITLYPSVTDIKERIDLAIITVPAEHSLAVVQACAEKHVKAAILIPAALVRLKKIWISRHRSLILQIKAICGSWAPTAWGLYMPEIP